MQIKGTIRSGFWKSIIALEILDSLTHGVNYSIVNCPYTENFFYKFPQRTVVHLIHIFGAPCIIPTYVNMHSDVITQMMGCGAMIRTLRHTESSFVFFFCFCLLNRLLRHLSKKTSRPAALAFVRGIHRWLGDSPHKGAVTHKVFPFDDGIMSLFLYQEWISNLQTVHWYFIDGVPACGNKN